MKSILIVTHCYAEKLPIFAKMLTAQISSLVLWPPHCDVELVVCATESDKATLAAIDGFGCHPVPTVRIHAMMMPKPDLFRRAIGRNRATFDTEDQPDVVWHADADYLFGCGCLDAVAAVEFGEYNSVIPRTAFIHRDHAAGDAEIARIEIGELHDPDESKFVAWKPKEAIGGLQIVRGDVARLGYLNGTKWQTPVRDVSEGFQTTVEDRKFRRLELKCNTMKADIPNCFRMRHLGSAFETPEQRLRGRK